MPIDVQFKVSNYKKVSQVAKELSNGERYRGYLKATIQVALQDLVVYTKAIVHKETGTLSSAVTWEYNSHTMRGRLFIAPWVFKLQGRYKMKWADEYAGFEHARGGDHAFFDRALKERAPFSILREMNANVRTFDFT